MSKIIYVSDDMGLDSPPMSPKNNAVDASVDTTPTVSLMSSEHDSNKNNDINPSVDPTTVSASTPPSLSSEVVIPNAIQATDEVQSVLNEQTDITKAIDNKEGGGDNESSSSYSDYSDDSSQGGDDVSVSSLATDDLLKVDPMYFRLTKFLQTGGMNVAEILSGIHEEMKNLNENLSKLAAK